MDPHIKDWLAADAAHCWHPFTQHAVDREPLPVVQAKGATLTLADGRDLIDGISSWWACLLGHGEPELIQAMADQATKMDHVLFAGCTHEPAARLAAELAAVAPGNLERIFFSDDGSTAVEVALKAAYQYWLRVGEAQRRKFIALEGGYHGDTFGAMAVGDPQPFFVEFDPLLFEVHRIAPNDEAFTHMEDWADETAAVILEPLVQGAAGMKSVPVEFTRKLQKWCEETGVLLIADEVFTGFGRTGTVFASEQAGLRPDLMCLAKGLTNGMFPLSVTLATDRIFEAFLSDERSRCLFHGHTFTANPVGCAIARKSLELTLQRKTPERFRQIGAQISEALNVLTKTPLEVRTIGGIVAVEVKGDASGYLSGVGDQLRGRCRDLPVLLRPLGNVLYAIPPSCASDDDCVRIAEAMTSVLA